MFFKNDIYILPHMRATKPQKNSIIFIAYESYRAANKKVYTIIISEAEAATRRNKNSIIFYCI